MTLTGNLFPLFIFRSLQALLAFIALGLSLELIRGHDPEHYPELSHVPKLLPCVAGISGLTIGGALTGFVLAWTECLRGYFEVVIDLLILLANVVGGILITIRIQGLNCADSTNQNRLGLGEYPFKGTLGGIDILNGGCSDKEAWCWNVSNDYASQLNARCKKSQADSAFMFLTAAVLFAIQPLTYTRMRRA